MAENLNNDDMILWFDDLGTGNEDYNFLSNFYEGKPLWHPDITVLEESVRFATAEHWFAAMKFWGSDWEHFFTIVEAPDPNTAKALGQSRRHPLRRDWEAVKYDVMASIVRTKFTLQRQEGFMLLNTEDLLLVEGTYWDDRVWGIDLLHDDLPGRNWLGTLLMARRAELRALALANTDRVSHFVTTTADYNIEFSSEEH